MVPLLVFDTNILMDLLFERNKSQATLLVGLVKSGKADLSIPEFVLAEFEGSAFQVVRSERNRKASIHSTTKRWKNWEGLALASEDIEFELETVDWVLKWYEEHIPETIEQLKQIAKITKHTADLHLRGELRHLRGLPPDQPGEGLKDCRIFECVLDIFQTDQANSRDRFLVTRDADFDKPELHLELKAHGAELRRDIGKLFGELR